MALQLLNPTFSTLLDQRSAINDQHGASNTAFSLYLADTALFAVSAKNVVSALIQCFAVFRLTRPFHGSGSDKSDERRAAYDYTAACAIRRVIVYSYTAFGNFAK